jgi:glycosyltransferase involved in cell wall biosynthesis
MPLAMLEAASAAKPIVCSDIPVFREIFGNGEVDFFELNDTEALVQAIRRAALHADERAKNANARFERDYSVSAMTRRYLEVYRLIH